MLTAAQSPSRGAASALAVVYLGTFLDIVGSSIILPLLSSIAHRSGGSHNEIGIIVAAYPAAQFLVAPLMGRAADRWGRRPVVLASLLGNVVSLALCALGAVTGHLGLLLAGRVLGGAWAGSFASFQLIVTDVSPAAERPARLGRLSAAMACGSVVGPLTGGVLGRGPTWLPFVGAGIAVLAALLLTASRLVETRPASPRDAAVASDEDAPFAWAAQIPLLVLVFAAEVLISGLLLLMPLRASAVYGWGPTEVGASLALLCVVIVAVQGFFVGVLTARFPPTSVILAGPLTMALGAVLLALTVTVAPALIGLALIAIGTGLVAPIATFLGAAGAAAHERGRVVGLQRAAGALGRVSGPLVSGALLASAVSNTPLWAFVAVSAVAAIASLGLRRITAHRAFDAPCI